VRELLKTFGILFGRRVGGFLRRAEEVIAGDLAVAPELRPVFEALVAARQAVLGRIQALDPEVRAAARRSRTVQLFISTPGVGPITALAVAAAFDDAARFPPLVERGRLSRPDAEALRIRRDQPQRPHLEAW
jgi:transposase